MALRREQHQQAFARDLILMVAEQAFGGRIQRQDAARQVERDGAVARPIEHGLKVAIRQTAVARRLAPGCAHSRPEFRFQRAAERDQRRRRAVPADHLRVAVDRQDLAVRPHDRDRVDVFGRHGSRIAIAEHPRERIRRLELCEIAIASELEQCPIGVESPPVAGDQGADRKTVQNRARVAPNPVIVGAARRRPIALPIRRLLGAAVDPGSRRVSAAAHSSEGSSREAGVRPTRARAISRNASRSLRLSSTLSAEKFCADFASQRVKRARADRNDVGRDGRRRVAKDVDRRGALGQWRRRLARRGTLGGIGLLALLYGRDGLLASARLGADSAPSALSEASKGCDIMSVECRRLELRFDRRPRAFSRLNLGLKLGRGPRRLGFDRLGQRRLIVIGNLCRYVAQGHSDGLDLLAQDAETAVAQKFAMAAEHRRGGQCDPPASIKPREGPSRTIWEKVWRSPSTRVSSSPRSNPMRRKRASMDFAPIGRVGADRCDKHRMRLAKAAFLVKGP